MRPKATGDKPMIVGAFDTIAAADQAVRDIRQAGFDEQQMGVMCSEKCHDRFFADVPEAKLDPATTPGVAIPAGTAIGGAIGGLALAATGLVTGGVSLLAAGTVLIGGGALAGTFAGAMASLGYDQKTVRLCEDLVEQGKILVAVEDFPPDHVKTLPRAQQLMERAGATRILWVPEKV